MTTITTPSLALLPSLKVAWQDVDSSFQRFCLMAGIGAIEQMLCEDTQQLAIVVRHAGVAPINELTAKLQAAESALTFALRGEYLTVDASDVIGLRGCRRRVHQFKLLRQQICSTIAHAGSLA
jgi:hypothetical protein